jgi:hypothetical protein
VDADLRMIDALARLQLEAGRLGLEVCLFNPSREVEELIAFAGLEDVLVVKPRRQTEQREEGLGVEEEGQLGDLPT